MKKKLFIIFNLLKKCLKKKKTSENSLWFAIEFNSEKETITLCPLNKNKNITLKIKDIPWFISHLKDLAHKEYKSECDHYVEV